MYYQRLVLVSLSLALLACSSDKSPAPAEPEFAYRILSPLPNSVLEKQRYSRMPLAVWVQYDYPEPLQITANTDILSKASDSGASWTTSLEIAEGDVDVEMLFWRGDQVIARELVPVRHEHLISAHNTLVYDPDGDRVIIVHEARLETLTIDLATGQSHKHFPWTSPIAEFNDAVFDAASGSIIYATDGLYWLNPAQQNPVTPVTNTSGISIHPQNLALSTDRKLFISDIDRADALYRQDLFWGSVEPLTLDETAALGAGSRLAFDHQQAQLFAGAADASTLARIDPSSGTVLEHFPGDWQAQPNPYQFAQIQPIAAQNRLFITAPKLHSLLQLDLASGAYSLASGTYNGVDRGTGDTLYKPTALTLDTARNRLLTLSASRLLGIDPISGDRSLIFGGKAGSGPMVTGVAGIWVDADGTRARAIDQRAGRFFDIDLATGVRTERSYSPGPHHQVTAAKLSHDGQYAALQLTSAAGPTTALWSLNLNNGETAELRTLAQDERLVNLQYSWPNDQLLVLTQDAQGQNQLQIFAPHTVEPLETLTPPGTEGASLLAIHRTHQQWLLLEKLPSEDPTAPTYQLSAVTSDLPAPQPLFSIPAENPSNLGFADLNLVEQGAVVVILLPAEPARFWQLAASREQIVNLPHFRGTDQVRDFYSVDDFPMVYYVRSASGLQICWNFTCAVVTN